MQTVSKPLYRSGCPVNKIQDEEHLPPYILQESQDQHQSFFGSINWLSCGMRIYIATIANLLEQHIKFATPSNVPWSHYVVKYLKGCKFLGITLRAQQSNDISSLL